MNFDSEGKSNKAFQDDMTGTESPREMSGEPEVEMIFPMSCSTPDRRLQKTISKVTLVKFGSSDDHSFNSDILDDTRQDLLHRSKTDMSNPEWDPQEVPSPKPDTSLLHCQNQDKSKCESSAKELQGVKGEKFGTKDNPHSSLNVVNSEISTILVEDEQKNSRRLSGIFQGRALKLSTSAARCSNNRTRLLSASSDSGLFCRICHQGDGEESFIYPCKCSGTMGAMHQTCVEKWLGLAGSDQCEICGFAFVTERREKPFTEWLYNPANPRERKNLVTDGLCFLVLTPLATVSTWLCIVGARHYYFRDVTGHHWETVGLSLLTMFLILIYVIWCAVALRFHRRTFLNWRKKNQAVRVLDSKQWKKPRSTKKNRTASISDHNNNEISIIHGNNASRLSSVAVGVPSRSTAVCTMMISCSHQGSGKKSNIVGLNCKTCALRRSQECEEAQLCSSASSTSGGSTNESSPQPLELNLSDSICPHRHFKVMLEIGSSFRIENMSV